MTSPDIVSRHSTLMHVLWNKARALPLPSAFPLFYQPLSTIGVRRGSARATVHVPTPSARPRDRT